MNHIHFLPPRYDGIGPGYVVCIAEWVEDRRTPNE